MCIIVKYFRMIYIYLIFCIYITWFPTKWLCCWWILLTTKTAFYVTMLLKKTRAVEMHHCLLLRTWRHIEQFWWPSVFKVRWYWDFLVRDSWLCLENSNCLLIDCLSRPIDNRNCIWLLIGTSFAPSLAMYHCLFLHKQFWRGSVIRPHTKFVCQSITSVQRHETSN